MEPQVSYPCESHTVDTPSLPQIKRLIQSIVKLPSDATAIIVNGTPQPPVQQSPTVGPSPGPSANGPTSPEVTQGPTGPSTDSSGNGDGITIPDFTTVLSAPSLGTLPKSGQAAISALKPAANAFVDGLNDVGCLISGLFGALFGGGGCDGRGGGGLTSGAVSTAAASLTTVIEGKLHGCRTSDYVADTSQMERDY